MKLSIITATYNCDSFLGDCLDSVAAQDAIENIEHIIVDGGSSDSTLSVAARYPHVRKIYSSPDRGIYHAFNRGVEMAEGDIIYFLGADDTLYDTSTLSKVLSTFSNDMVDYVSTRVRCFDEKTEQVWFTHASESEGTNVCHQGFFCRKSLFQKIGPFNECFRLYADSFFMKTAIRQFNGICLDVISANFRQGGSSSLSANRSTLQLEAKAVSLLLGESAPSTEHQLDLNVIDLKGLLEKILCKEDSLERYHGMSVAIFGTRQLSVIIAQALQSVGANLECFVTSEEQRLLNLKNISVKSLYSLERLPIDFVINCIEGKHEHAIAEDIRRHVKCAEIVSWRNL
ncbi:glycosyltransferase [Alteromonas sp. KS69]|uniref:glycosyltransferase family 2 protein n=1 Tax=Alteromonas sp. KS69 TaxID=2109917 RepID=UPI000F88CEC6|nr:glycosyltransferase family 2 protein [Alteromonas sp. KS69]RUP82654.1 glycosyltransferase [Alteromonas sp. KS69]